MRLQQTPWTELSDLRELLSILQPARIVGGAVRNAILGMQLSDIDVATELLPEEVSKIARKAGFKVIPTGISHGTVTCVKTGSYEVTTLRVDKDTDGRHAVVEFSRSWTCDAERRDFTMNALYSDFEGNVIDMVSGIEDLTNRYIRFIGRPRERIQEDYLRILRFFRFYAHYCLEYDPVSHKACVELAEHLNSISRERCTYEFMRLLEAKNAYKGIILMPEKVFISAGLPLPLENTIPTIQYLKLSKIGRLSTFAPTHELVLPKQQLRLVRQLQSLNEMHELSDYVKWINICDEEIMLDGITLQGKNPKIGIEQLQTWIDNKFPLKGKDIISIGYEPGPQITQVLDKAMDLFCASPAPMSKRQLIDLVEKFTRKD